MYINKTTWGTLLGCLWVIPILSAQNPSHKMANGHSIFWNCAITNTAGLFLEGGDSLNATNFVQLDNDGDTVWTAHYDLTAQVSVNNSRQLVRPNGSFLFYQQFTDSICIWGANSQLAFTIGKSYQVDTNIFLSGASTWEACTEISGGQTALLGTTEVGPGNRFPSVALFDANLNIVWSRQYDIPGLLFTPQFVVERTDRLIIIGMANTFNPMIMGPRSIGYLVVSKTDGSLLQPIAGTVGVSPGSIFVGGISADGKYAVGWTETNITDPGYGFIAKLSDTGSPLFEWVNKLQSADFPHTGLRFIDYDFATDMLYVGGEAGKANSFGLYSDRQYFLGAIHSGDTVFSWASAYTDTMLTNTGLAMAGKITGNNLLSCGTFTGTNGPGYMIIADKQTGASGCLDMPFEITTNAAILVNTLYSVSSDSNLLYAPQDWTPGMDAQINGLVEETSVICQINTVGTEPVPGDITVGIYPNPAADAFRITFNDPGVKYSEVRVYNMAGQQIYQQMSYVEGSLIPAAFWTPGVYMVVCRYGQEVKTLRIVKQ